MVEFDFPGIDENSSEEDIKIAIDNMELDIRPFPMQDKFSYTYRVIKEDFSTKENDNEYLGR